MVRACLGEQAREEALYAAFQCWQTGADDTNIGLRAAPDGWKWIVPRDVFGHRDHIERLEAEDGDDASTAHR